MKSIFLALTVVASVFVANTASAITVSVTNEVVDKGTGNVSASGNVLTFDWTSGYVTDVTISVDQDFLIRLTGATGYTQPGASAATRSGILVSDANGDLNPTSQWGDLFNDDGRNGFVGIGDVLTTGILTAGTYFIRFTEGNTDPKVGTAVFTFEDANTSAAPVPVPAPLLPLAFGLAALVGVARSRRAA